MLARLSLSNIEHDVYTVMMFCPMISCISHSCWSRLNQVSAKLITKHTISAASRFQTSSTGHSLFLSLTDTRSIDNGINPSSNCLPCPAHHPSGRIAPYSGCCATRHFDTVTAGPAPPPFHFRHPSGSAPPAFGSNWYDSKDTEMELKVMLMRCSSQLQC